MEPLSVGNLVILAIALIIVGILLYISVFMPLEKAETKAKWKIRKQRRRGSRPDYNTSKSERE